MELLSIRTCNYSHLHDLLYDLDGLVGYSSQTSKNEIRMSKWGSWRPEGDIYCLRAMSSVPFTEL